MEERRMEEIALALIRYKMSHDGIRINPNVKRDAGNIAKATKIPLADLYQFGKTLMVEFVEKNL